MEADQQKIPRIFLWCFPRTVSTALTKCMSFVDGADIWLEPYCHASINFAIDNEEFLDRYSSIRNIRRGQLDARAAMKDQFNGQLRGNLKPDKLFTHLWVKEQLETINPAGKKFIFIKDMAFAVSGAFGVLPSGVPCRHTFLVRHPHRALPSLRKHMINMFEDENEGDAFDIGADNHPFPAKSDALHDLWTHVKTSGLDPDPIVINTDDLLTNPADVLSKYFAKLGIQWDPKYLKWPASKEVVETFNTGIGYQRYGDDKGIFSAAFKSDSFWPLKSPLPDFDDLSTDCKQTMPILCSGYEEMNETRIRLLD